MLVDEIQRMLEDEGKSPDPPGEFVLNKDGQWACGPLSIRNKGFTRGGQSPKVSIECRLDQHYDLDGMNDSQWITLRLHHWFRFRGYNIFFAAVEGKSGGKLHFRIEKQPSRLVPLQFARENTLALHEIGHSEAGLHVWVRCLGDYEMILRTEVSGTEPNNEDRWFRLGAGGFARGTHYDFYDAKLLDKAISFRPEPDDRAGATRAVCFDEDLDFSVADWLEFSDGLVLGVRRIHRFGKKDWRPEVILRKGSTERGGDVRVGKEARFDVVGTYEVRVLSLQVESSEMPSVSLRVALRREAKFRLGESIVLQEGEIRETEEGFRLRYLRTGHKHGSKGFTDEGHEIHHTWGWFDFEVAFGAESEHIKIDLPEADKGQSFPMVCQWRKFLVHMEGYEAGSSRVRVELAKSR